MRHPHLTSGGRYPALRTIAVLYLIGAVCVVGLCVWQAIRVVAWGADGATTELVGPTNTASAKAMAVVCWLAAAFIGLIVMLAIAELIKLFIDIEHNTRLIAHNRPATAAADAAAMSAAATGAAAAAVNGQDGDVLIREGPAVPFAGDRKLLDGDEPAEGALLRGH